LKVDQRGGAMEWLENLGLNEGVSSGLMVVAVELVLLFVAYLLVSFLLNFLQKRLSRIPAPVSSASSSGWAHNLS
jgi:hypothetical protein